MLAVAYHIPRKVMQGMNHFVMSASLHVGMREAWPRSPAAVQPATAVVPVGRVPRGGCPSPGGRSGWRCDADSGGCGPGCRGGYPRASRSFSLSFAKVAQPPRMHFGTCASNPSNYKHVFSGCAIAQGEKAAPATTWLLSRGGEGNPSPMADPVAESSATFEHILGQGVALGLD